MGAPKKLSRNGLCHDSIRCEHCGGTLLTGREADIITLICEGHAHKEIGYRLNLSLGTIKMYVNRIYDRLEELHIKTEEGEAIRTMPALAVWWLRN